jgi:predicted P-loop ATPase/GTPase
LRYLFVRLREIHEYVLTRESTATTTSPELSRLLKQKSIYDEILNEKQTQLKIIIDTVRDITYQINTMIDLRQDGTINTSMNNANTQEK